MRLLKMFFRNEEQQNVEVVECWEVRWTSRHGRFSSDIKPEVVAFHNKRDAEIFKSALEDAFKLVKITADADVKLSKQCLTFPQKSAGTPWRWLNLDNG